MSEISSRQRQKRASCRAPPPLISTYGSICRLLALTVPSNALHGCKQAERRNTHLARLLRVCRRYCCSERRSRAATTQHVPHDTRLLDTLGGGKGATDSTSSTRPRSTQHGPTAAGPELAQGTTANISASYSCTSSNLPLLRRQTAQGPRGASLLDPTFRQLRRRGPSHASLGRGGRLAEGSARSSLCSPYQALT